MAGPIEARETVSTVSPLMERLQKDAQGDTKDINGVAFHASQFLKLGEFLTAFPEDRQKKAIAEAENKGKVSILRRVFCRKKLLYRAYLVGF